MILSLINWVVSPARLTVVAERRRVDVAKIVGSNPTRPI